jgi:hypothetical protein
MLCKRVMTLVQFDAIEFGLRFHRQFPESPRPDAHEIGVDHLERTMPNVEVEYSESHAPSSKISESTKAVLPL